MVKDGFDIILNPLRRKITVIFQNIIIAAKLL